MLCQFYFSALRTVDLAGTHVILALGLSKKNPVIAIPQLYCGRSNLQISVELSRPCFTDYFIRLPLRGLAHSQ
jgi:hypothetical protein